MESSLFCRPRPTLPVARYSRYSPRSLSNFLSGKPSVLIVDDDYLKPNSVEILESIRNVNKEMKIIFASSDSSLELGKKVSQLGIYYYAIKPIDESEFKELLDSLLNTKSKQIN